MKNPAKPGDFGTNGTRGVVMSGMSETTKRTLGADMIDLSVPWAERIDRTHLAARPVEKQALRASRLGAEGGVRRETTSSPAEIGTACTGRKMASARVALCATMIVFLLVCIWNIGGVWSAFGAIGVVIWANLFRIERASGGEGV